MPTSIRSSVGSLLGSICAVLSLALSSQVGAQIPPARDGQPDLIPRDLVVALLTFGSGVGGTDLKVGKVPDDTPPEFIAPGAEILGSVTQFENLIVVLGVKETPDSAVGATQARLLAAGWTRPPAPASPAPTARGFVTADFPGTSGLSSMPDALCRGDQSVTLSSMYRSSGGSLLKVAFNRGARYSICRRREDVAMHRSPYEDAPIPLLRAPPGSMMTGGSGTSASSNQVTVSTRLSTRLTPGEVVAHYDTQMRAAGWAAVSNGALDFMAARTYQKADDKARSWSAVLYTIKSPDARDQDVALTLSRR